ncbi:aminopeptidase P family protein [Proteiniclasticum sp. SCR006]|uniref:Aminopeptidase P family protein n=1 Tax=Proteiniclasticum aestuarii TaxID=2817862 RepID=A0A939KFZ8_9CLOT|nr:Xaa-Pro peptidase family protein [Proteiniclasticum aestuarii]MBO1264987.1 aminopeptidase P family protein [Proteiniclasticum aestuarii]
MYSERIEKLRALMKEKNLTQLLVTDTASIFYLTGRWIEAGERLLVLLIRQSGKPVFFINELFPEKESEDLDFVWIKDTTDSIALLAEKLEKEEILGIDKNWPSGFLIRLMETTGSAKVVNSSLLLDLIRSRKDEEEIQFMREASRLNDDAMTMLIDALHEDMTEKEMEDRLREIYDSLGAEGFSFTPIIAYGKNGANPHHENSHRLLKEGDSVILDIGCRKDNYASDMTRTVFYMEVDEKAKEVYETVLEANRKAIDKVKPGMKFSEIDQAARAVIEEKGYGKYFTHRTGHSIGIEVHEYGDVSSANEDLLMPGMIFSVEPGIYLEGELGVRIEDLVLVTEEGHEVLNSYPKDLQIIR